MAAIQYRMPSGIPGVVTRVDHATVEPVLLDSATPFSAFGLPGKTVSGKFVPAAAGTAAADVNGFLVRSFPGGASQDGLGTSTPQVGGLGGRLRRGYINALLSSGSVAAAKDGQVYLRVATAGTGKPIGGLEAAADSTNTVAIPNCFFMGPADASGNVEIAFNI